MKTRLQRILLLDESIFDVNCFSFADHWYQRRSFPFTGVLQLFPLGF
jgi:hypothetical protein